MTQVFLRLPHQIINYNSNESKDLQADKKANQKREFRIIFEF